jgi:hypothetical protein
MSSEDAAHSSSPSRDALAESVFNSKDAAEEKAKPMDFLADSIFNSKDTAEEKAKKYMDSFAISSERPAPASDTKSKTSPIQGCGILGSTPVVELPPPVRFTRRIRTISAAPRGPTPAKESVDVFGSESALHVWQVCAISTGVNPMKAYQEPSN